MRARRFHGLKRLKIRQTWNKYNLYNLSRLEKPNLYKTHFQQKWAAKAAARAYHGEQVREKQWQIQFTPRVKSVIPMDHRYLAAFDGSEQAQGRGSGKEVDPNEAQQRKGASKTLLPYANMTFATLERRLDTAVFRALFASSARQARQFVVHGAVKVNGKKMIYPGYLLNPGDMFQVDPERVLFATGAAKDARERRLGRQARRKEREAKEASAESTETTGESEADRSEAAISETTNAVAAEADSSANAEETTQKAAKVTLQDLLSKAKSILADDADVASAKRKQELRAFTATVRSAIGKVNKKTAAAVESTLTNLDDELNTLLSKLSISSAPKAATTSTTTPAKAGDGQLISKEDRQALREALRNARENPIDPSKPYATPWRPRPYMSAFAFIPRYLEVNQNICSAVYLRHPVVRPGLAEVPTPFAPELNQLAFTWYLRRR